MCPLSVGIYTLGILVAQCWDLTVWEALFPFVQEANIGPPSVLGRDSPHCQLYVPRSIRTCVPSGLVAPSTRERVGCSPLLGVPGLQDRGATPRPTGTTPFVPLGTGVRVSGQSAPLRTTDIGTCSLLTSLTFCPCRAGLRLENPGFTPGAQFCPVGLLCGSRAHSGAGNSLSARPLSSGAGQWP